MPKPRLTPKTKKRFTERRPKDANLQAILLGARERIEEWRRRWRLHRKMTAHSTPLEFSLRPHLALLIYTMGISLIGRGLCHLNGEPAYWGLWWSEDLGGIFAWLMSESWHAYTTDPEIEGFLHSAQSILMWLYLSIGCIALYAPRRLSQALRSHGRASSLDLKRGEVNRKTRGETSAQEQRLADPPSSSKLFSRLFIIAALLQLLYLLCQWISYNYYWATLAEHAMQVAIPMTCVLMLPYTPQEWEKPAELFLMFTLSLCFIGHGVYALDLLPLPADFVMMTMNILGVTEGSAHIILTLFGSLDLIAALLIWIPISELRRGAILYMIAWGALTAIARPLGQPSTTLLERLIVWGPEGLWRLSHALVPMWLWRRRYV